MAAFGLGRGDIFPSLAGGPPGASYVDGPPGGDLFIHDDGRNLGGGGAVVTVTIAPREDVAVAIRREFDARTSLVDSALETVPTLLEESGWTAFWVAVRSMPESDLPGFLSGHRQHLPASRFVLSLGAETFAHYPSPINTPKGFAALAAFLKLAQWHFWRRTAEDLKIDLQKREAIKDEITAYLREELQRIEERVKHPKIMDSNADVIKHLKARGSFQDSLRAFRSLAEVRRKDSYDIVFDHPHFIWIEGARTDAEAEEAGPAHGKWIVPLPSLEEATAAAKGLLPHFESGRLTCAKFLTATVEPAGIYLLVYAVDQDLERRRILEEVCSQSSFFVYDRDCYEAEALGGAVEYLVKSLQTKEIQPEVIEAHIARYEPLLNDPEFGETAGLSPIQRDILRAVLKRNQDSDPSDRAVYLALTYFEGCRATVGAILPKLLDPTKARILQAVTLLIRRQYSS